ncbi:MAG: hypothetical protein M3O50_13725 [Myxococcota bacterium]|nr:hypothetical protein [Myxococcota bacterium]
MAYRSLVWKRSSVFFFAAIMAPNLIACTSNDGASGSDAGPGGTSDTGSMQRAEAAAPGGDAGTTQDSGGASVPETSTGATGCGTYKSGSDVCDQCIAQANPCCNSALICSTPDDGGVDDAGRTPCEQELSCIYRCASGLSNPNRDAAPPSYAECTTQCRGGYSNDVSLKVVSISVCTQGLCKAQCPYLQ